MKKYVAWPLVIILAALPIVYFFLRLLGVSASILLQSVQGQDFLDGTMGNWFATMMGLIAGVPIGLWINRKQQEEQEKIKKRETAGLRKERKVKILNLIRDELIFNRDTVGDLISKQDEQPGIVYVTGTKDMLWSALSDGGELQWVDDLDLLNKLADAYYHVKALIFLEKQHFDPNFKQIIAVYGDERTYAGKAAVEGLMNIRPGSLHAIENAINAIDLHLRSLN